VNESGAKVEAVRLYHKCENVPLDSK